MLDLPATMFELVYTKGHCLNAGCCKWDLRSLSDSDMVALKVTHHIHGILV